MRELNSCREGSPLKTLVLGLGNPILTDDGVGIHVVRRAARYCKADHVSFAEACVGGLRLLDMLLGFERVLLVDAIQTADSEPGTIFRLQPTHLQQSLHSGSSHDLTLAGALALGRSLDLPLPDDDHLTILAIEAEDVLTFGEECTPAVRAAIACAVDRICDELATQPEAPKW
jgi:hydrogenase maturation protease